ncbi:LAFE_0G02762g1_1 [Lachancea fermentati]|uniref:Folic acid synthesis protein fol1 n=1 Tax=Lachancea fermentati TaxID=4955 RepID=A0A1G4MH56_LACFM|nr:LAFE_0G02762g1_1 [Lachancea fermentati]
MESDYVHIEKLRLKPVVGPDSWRRLSPQDCVATLQMRTNFEKASENDDLKYSLNYAVISRDIEKYIEPFKNYWSIGYLNRNLSNYLVAKYPGIQSLILDMQTRSGHIRSDDIRAVVVSQKNIDDEIIISNLKLLTLIGVFTFERLQKQYVNFEIRIPWPKKSREHVPYNDVIDNVVEYVENSNFKTVEALVENVAQVITQIPYFIDHPKLAITVKVLKLNAITSTDGVGVSCTKSAVDFVKKQPIGKTGGHSSMRGFDLPVDSQAVKITKSNTAIVAFGSNVGDRFENIKSAIDILDAHPSVTVMAVSSIFESEPMYFKNQSLFLNGCLKIQTNLNPEDLLKLCKTIEYENLKRTKEFDNGPRSIDLDIILYKNSDGEDILLTTETLTIPHPRLLERSFVLEPLCELISSEELHPVTAEPYHNHLSQLYGQGNEEDFLWKLVPLPSIGKSKRFLKFKNEVQHDLVTGSPITRTVSSTYIMGILNTTPDSFSDGGIYFESIDKQLDKVKIMIDDVLRLFDYLIIDIGGCSTRPNSEQTSSEEELKRTIPIIKAIRKDTGIPQERIILSIDTYRADVASQAIAAGVDIVNDISGGQFDKSILSVLAENPTVAYVLSHTRGNISTMNKLTEYGEPSDDTNISEFLHGRENSDSRTSLIRNVGRELAERYEEAISNGIRRWQVIIDPGIGFAKNPRQNLEIIRQLDLLKNYSCTKDGSFLNFRNLPILVGASRKKFIGTITGDEIASERDFATGSLSASCVGNGANIIRVHDTKGCSKSIKLADALYRRL